MAVKAWRIVGLTAVPDDQAQAFLSAYLARPLALEGINRVAEQFEQWLRSRGLFTARAYVPPQNIEQGTVELRVLEGVLEDISVKTAPGTRLSEAMLRDFLAQSLSPGSALTEERLERGLLLMNDLPSTSARAVLAPGKQVGGSRVVIEAAQGPVLTGSADLDNGGNRYTGAYRVAASLQVNDAYGLGDLWSLRGSASQGSSFVRGAYNLPLGADGWRAGAALIASRYALCCDDAVKALDSNGSAAALSAYLSYPAVRSRLNNLNLVLNGAGRSFVNRSLGSTTSDKRSVSVSLSANGDHSDALSFTGLGAYTSYSVQVSGIYLNLDRWAADQVQDASTAQTQGGSLKFYAQVSQVLRLDKDATLYASALVQTASKNLDSSEKFALGGPQGLRAYPIGEASGDDAALLNLEWRKEFTRPLGLLLFFDAGWVQLHHVPWASWNANDSRLKNRYALAGAGASVVWDVRPGAQVQATVAVPIGRNPGRDAKGHDSDGRSGSGRLWLLASLAY
jgi:hemolysin activation/secretion protein